CRCGSRSGRNHCRAMPTARSSSASCARSSRERIERGAVTVGHAQLPRFPQGHVIVRRFRSVHVMTMQRYGWAAFTLACLIGSARPALAEPLEPAWMTSVLEEDDFWSPGNKDRHYTHGFRITMTSPDVHSRFWQAPFDWIGSFTSAFPSRDQTLAGGESVLRRYNITPLAQSMFTPQNPALAIPDPRDPPIAASPPAGVAIDEGSPGAATQPLKW